MERSFKTLQIYFFQKFKLNISIYYIIIQTKEQRKHNHVTSNSILFYWFSYLFIYVRIINNRLYQRFGLFDSLEENGILIEDLDLESRK